jgi:hypothetical protein
VTKGIRTIPWTWRKKILVQPQFGGVTTFYSWRSRRCVVDGAWRSRRCFA